MSFVDAMQGDNPREDIHMMAMAASLRRSYQHNASLLLLSVADDSDEEGNQREKEVDPRKVARSLQRSSLQRDNRNDVDDGSCAVTVSDSLISARTQGTNTASFGGDMIEKLSSSYCPEDFTCITCGLLLRPGMDGTTVRLCSLKRGRTRRRRASRYKAKEILADSQSLKHRGGGAGSSSLGRLSISSSPAPAIVSLTTTMTTPTKSYSSSTATILAAKIRKNEQRKKSHLIRRTTDGTCRHCIVYTCGYCKTKLKYKGLPVSNMNFIKRKQYQTEKETAEAKAQKNWSIAKNMASPGSVVRPGGGMLEKQMAQKGAKVKKCTIGGTPLQRMASKQTQQQRRVQGSQYTGHTFAGKDLTKVGQFQSSLLGSKTVLPTTPKALVREGNKDLVGDGGFNHDINPDLDFIPLGEERGGGGGKATDAASTLTAPSTPGLDVMDSRQNTSGEGMSIKSSTMTGFSTPVVRHEKAGATNTSPATTGTPTWRRLDEMGSTRKRKKKKKSPNDNKDSSKKKSKSELMDFLSSLND